jgi:hypothetical protein
MAGFAAGKVLAELLVENDADSIRAIERQRKRSSG